MSIKSVIAATVFAFTSLSAHAQLWTMTTSGTISEGLDYTGVFGIKGQDLSGLHYTNTFTIGVNPDKWSTNSYVSGLSYGGKPQLTHELKGVGPWLMETITISDNSYAFYVPTSGGVMTLRRTASDEGDLGGQDNIVQTMMQGNFSNDSSILVNLERFDGRAFLQSVEFTDGFFVSAGLTNIEITGAQRVSIAGVNDWMQASANPVPEPETGAMLLAGLALIGVISRRRQRYSAG